MLQPFYRTRPDARGEYDEYFVDSAGAIVTRERVRDLGRALTLRPTCFRQTRFFEAFGQARQKVNSRSYLPPLMLLRSMPCVMARYNALTLAKKRPLSDETRSPGVVAPSDSLGPFGRTSSAGIKDPCAAP